MNSTISFNELSQKIKVKDIRTLESTDGFPEYKINNGEFMFPLEEVCKFFKINDITEGFITVEEASKLLNISVNILNSYINCNEIPYYRLKSIRGSAILLRESELRMFFKSPTLSPDSDFINKFVGRSKINLLFKELLLIYMKTVLTENEMEIVKGYFFEGCSFEFMADHYGLSRERIRQIFEKAYKKIKLHIYRLENFGDYNKILSENIQLKRVQQHISKNTKEAEEDSFAKFYNYMNQNIHILDGSTLSVRALNILHYSFDFVWELYLCVILRPRELIRYRNVGKKTNAEIKDFVHETASSLFPELNLKELFISKEIIEKFNEVKKHYLAKNNK